MKVEKFDNKLKLIVEDADDGKTWYDLVYEDAMEMNDITYYMSSMDLWQYLYDANRGLVFALDGYGWNKLNEFLDGNDIEREGIPNDEGYEGMEWNEGLVWNKIKGGWCEK